MKKLSFLTIILLLLAICVASAESAGSGFLINGCQASGTVQTPGDSIEIAWSSPGMELWSVCIYNSTTEWVAGFSFEEKGDILKSDLTVGNSYSLKAIYSPMGGTFGETKTVTMSFIFNGDSIDFPENDFDFRKFNWGDPESKIREIEGDPAHVTETGTYGGSMLTYVTTAVGLDVYLNYMVDDNGLFSAGYIITEQHNNPALYIEDFEKFKNALISKYGAPIYDKENWTNGSKKSYYADNKGDALQYGYLSYEVRFETNTTTIVMTMDSDNYKISTNIVYLGKTIELPAPDYSNDI